MHLLLKNILFKKGIRNSLVEFISLAREGPA